MCTQATEWSLTEYWAVVSVRPSADRRPFPSDAHWWGLPAGAEATRDSTFLEAAREWVLTCSGAANSKSIITAMLQTNLHHSRVAKATICQKVLADDIEVVLIVMGGSHVGVVGLLQRKREDERDGEGTFDFDWIPRQRRIWLTAIGTVHTNEFA